jgi:4'-phosphopantetheinyl transferase
MQLVLDPGEVHVWYALPRWCSTASLVREYEALLTSEETARLAAFRFERHRLEYLVTRALVRSVLSAYRRLAPEEWRFRRTASGRPEVDPPCGIRFSLANSPAFVICAVSAHEVGVDVEAHARADDIVEVAPTVLSPRELQGLNGLPRDAARDRALALWTLKESYVKARGLGLTIPLDAVTFTFGRAGEVQLEVDPAWADAGTDWRFWMATLAGHRVAVTAERVRGQPLRISMREIVPLRGGLVTPGLHTVE